MGYGLKMAVCEDSLTDMELFRREIARALAKLELCMDIDSFRNGEDLLRAVRGGADYALLFLDIYMQSLDGIQTARAVREYLPDVQLAFLTTSREYSLDAFGLDALHYLIKPIDSRMLGECMERFCARSRIAPTMLRIASEFKTYSFPLADVQKIVSRNKGVDVFLRNMPPQHIPITLASAEKQLDPALFLKVSRGFVVQMSHILCIDRDVCRLKDGTEVLVSRQAKSEIRQKYNDYLFRM